MKDVEEAIIRGFKSAPTRCKNCRVEFNTLGVWCRTCVKKMLKACAEHAFTMGQGNIIFQNKENLMTVEPEKWHELKPLFKKELKEAEVRGKTKALKVFKNINITEGVWKKKGRNFTKKELIQLSWIKEVFDELFEKEIKE